MTNLLLTVQGSSDIYMLDLQSKYWNIGDLGAIPSAIVVMMLQLNLCLYSVVHQAVVLDHSQLATLNASLGRH